MNNFQDLITIKNEMFSKLESFSGRIALGLDFGMHCGFAYAFYSDKDNKWVTFPKAIGVVNLSPTRYESGSACFIRLLDFLDLIKPSVIFYELVRYTPPMKDVNASEVMARTSQSLELLTSLRQTALIWSETNNTPFIGITIQEIKKYATGKGRANKDEIIEQCNKRFGTNFDINDNNAHNAADAAFVLFAGLQTFNLKNIGLLNENK